MSDLNGLIPKKSTPEERRFFQRIGDAIKSVSTRADKAGEIGSRLNQIAGFLGEYLGVNPLSGCESPSVPTGFYIVSGFTTIGLWWDTPSYSGHGFVEIFRSKTNDLEAAILHARTNLSQYADSVEPDTAYYYWVRNVSKCGFKSGFNSTDGTEGMTHIDIGLKIEDLEGQISETQLANDLASRIDLIDGPDTLDGSLAQQVSQVSTTLGDQVAAVEAKADASIDAIGNIVTQYTVKLDSNGYVSGFGMINDGATSSFIVNADTFAIGKPGATANYPFIVDDGKVYMKNALIQNLSATNFVAGKIVADEVNVSNLSSINSNLGAVTAGSLSIGLASNNAARFAVATNGAMTIRDSLGNIILSSGSSTAIPASAVSGLGTLATKDSVDYGAVSGTKPPADADRTASNVAAGISGQGNFATLNQITSSNASTYIDSAAIGNAHIANAAITNAKIDNLAVTNAKIANLAVDTLKIANNAVTTLISGTLNISINLGIAGVNTVVIASCRASGGWAAAGRFVVFGRMNSSGVPQEVYRWWELWDPKGDGLTIDITEVRRIVSPINGDLIGFALSSRSNPTLASHITTGTAGSATISHSSVVALSARK